MTRDEALYLLCDRPEQPLPEAQAVKLAARRLGIGPRWIRRWPKSGPLPKATQKAVLHACVRLQVAAQIARATIGGDLAAIDVRLADAVRFAPGEDLLALL